MEVSEEPERPARRAALASLENIQAELGVRPDGPKGSGLAFRQACRWVFASENAHNQHAGRFNAILDGMRHIDGTPIASANVIDRWPELRALCDLLEARDEPVIILVRRIHPEPVDAPFIEARKVRIRRFAKVIAAISHSGISAF
jgi:hypothetical protein